MSEKEEVFFELHYSIPFTKNSGHEQRPDALVCILKVG